MTQNKPMIIIDEQEHSEPAVCFRSQTSFRESMVPSLRTQSRVSMSNVKPLIRPNLSIRKAPQPTLTAAPIQMQKIPSCEFNSTEFTDKMWGTLKPEERAKLLKLINKFREQMRSDGFAVQSPLRRDAVERIFASVIYGVEEINRSKQAPNQKEQIIRAMSPQAQYDFSRKLTLSIESELLRAFPHTSKKQLNSYPETFSMLFRHLRDDQNSELRLKVLTSVLTPRQLVTSKEDDLQNSKKRMEARNREMQYWNSLAIQKPKITQLEQQVAIEDQISERVEKKKVITMQERIETVISNARQKLTKMVDNMPAEWIDLLKKDLPQAEASQLIANLKGVLGRPEERKEAEGSFRNS